MSATRLSAGAVNNPVLLGLDIGTTNCKLVAFSPSGEILAEARTGYEVECPLAGWSELNPDHVFEAVEFVLASVAPKLSHHDYLAMAISAQGEAFVPVDSSGRALSKSPISVDRRGLGLAQALEEKLGRDRIAEITGQQLNELPTLSKLLWFREHRRDLIVKTWKFLCFGEYIQFRLGLTPCTDYSMAARTAAFDVVQMAWSDTILDAADLSPDLFPKVGSGHDLVGRLSADIAAGYGYNAPFYIFVGGHDQPCAALGAGLLNAGTGLYSIGTTEAIAVATPGADPRFPMRNIPNYPHVLPGKFIALAGSQTGGRALDWYHSLIADENVSKASSGEFGELPSMPSSAIFLPHLAGSGSVLNDPGSRGLFGNLSFETTRGELDLALLEGLTMEQAITLNTMKATGLKLDYLRAVGGGTQSAAMMQVRADILDIPIETTSCA